MAWSLRGNRRYYYRNVRTNGQVNTEYFGAGPLAEFIAEEDAEQRAERKAKRELWRQKRDAMDTLDTQVGDWWDAAPMLLKSQLYAEGYYQHDRGAWRKRRDPIRRCHEADSQSRKG